VKPPAACTPAWMESAQRLLREPRDADLRPEEVLRPPLREREVDRPLRAEVFRTELREPAPREALEPDREPAREVPERDDDVPERDDEERLVELRPPERDVPDRDALEPAERDVLARDEARFFPPREVVLRDVPALEEVPREDALREDPAREEPVREVPRDPDREAADRDVDREPELRREPERPALSPAPDPARLPPP
jgi:hypothetical protein